MSEKTTPHHCAEPDVRTLGDAAYARVINADSDAEAVGWATGDMSAIVQGWADGCENRRKELWTQAAHANDALYERFRDRIEALPVAKTGAK